MQRKRFFPRAERQWIPGRLRAEIMMRQEGRCADCGTRLIIGFFIIESKYITKSAASSALHPYSEELTVETGFISKSVNFLYCRSSQTHRAINCSFHFRHFNQIKDTAIKG